MIAYAIAAVLCALSLAVAWVVVERIRAQKHEAIADLRRSREEDRASYEKTIEEQRGLIKRLITRVDAYQLRTRKAALKNGWLTPAELDADEVTD